MTRIRTVYLARLAIAVERHRVEAHCGHPKLFFDRHTQALGAPQPGIRLGVIAAGSRQRCHRSQCGVGIALHFRNGHRASWKTPIGMEHGIMAVLPRLIHEAGFFATGVVEKAGRAALEAALDPRSCRQQGLPNAIDQRTIAGALLISAGQHDEQRGRVHATVILAERHFAQGGHFAAPCFVHDLARLRIAEAGVFLRLC